MWARIMKDRFGVAHPRAQQLRFHAQTAGSTLTAQQPDNNLVRVTRAGAGGRARRRAVAALQRRATKRWRCRPRNRPRSRCARSRSSRSNRASRTRSIRSAARTKSNSARTRSRKLRGAAARRIEAAGGTLAAIESGMIQREIQDRRSARSGPSTRANRRSSASRRFQTDERSRRSPRFASIPTSSACSGHASRARSRVA